MHTCMHLYISELITVTKHSIRSNLRKVCFLWWFRGTFHHTGEGWLQKWL